MTTRPRTEQPALPDPPSRDLIGYARVSTAQQAASLDEQAERLRALGCVRVFTDTASGARASRPGLDALRAFVRDGDAVVVTRLDRLGRSMLDTLTTLHDLDAQGVRVRALDLNLDTATAAGQMVVNIMAALSEYERALLAERTREGLAHARARGRKGGRRHALDPEAVHAVSVLLDEGSMSIPDIAALHGVSPRTIRRVRAGDYRKGDRP